MRLRPHSRSSFSRVAGPCKQAILLDKRNSTQSCLLSHKEKKHMMSHPVRRRATCKSTHVKVCVAHLQCSAPRLGSRAAHARPPTARPTQSTCLRMQNAITIGWIEASCQQMLLDACASPLPGSNLAIAKACNRLLRALMFSGSIPCQGASHPGAQVAEAL